MQNEEGYAIDMGALWSPHRVKFTRWTPFVEAAILGYKLANSARLSGLSRSAYTTAPIANTESLRLTQGVSDGTHIFPQYCDHASKQTGPYE